MSNNCWDLNPNCFVKIKPDYKCPAYEQKKNCYEMDWFALMQPLPVEKRKAVCTYMEEKCTACPVYKENKAAMDEAIQKLRTSIP